MMFKVSNYTLLRPRCFVYAVGTFFSAVGTFLSVLMIVSVASLQTANAQQTVDPSLIQALEQATRDIHEKTTDIDALVWLSSMSEKLEKRIPNAFYRVRLLESIYAEAQIAGLDPQLVLAVIDIESNFDRHALSSAGAQGLMQVMPFWKDVYNGPNDDLYNPLVSLRYGCKILRHYLDKYPTPRDALAAYNGSLGRDKYPNKIFKRLASRWQYKDDPYSGNLTPKVAVTDSNQVPIN